MKTNIKNTNSYTRTLSVVVPWESIKEEFNKEFLAQSKKFKIDGFRAGKVPRNIVQREIGPAIEANFGEKALNKYYQQALLELKIIPINQAQITDLSFKQNEDFNFTAIFEVRPKFKLPDYKKKIKFKINRYTISDLDVKHSLSELQNNQSKLKEVSKASIGNYILADFQELDENGVAIIGNKIEKQYIKLGEGNFDEKVSDLICGKKVSDKVVVDLPYGEEKITKFELEIKKIEEQVLPKLDSKFAKSINPDFKGIKDLESELEKNITKNLNDDFDKRCNGKIIDYFVDKTKVDVPKSMLDMFLKNMFEDEKKKPENKNIDESEFSEKNKPYAEKNIKWLFCRDELIKELEIKINDKQVDDFIKQLCIDNNQQKSEIKKYYQDLNNKKNLKSDLLTQSLFKKINDFATIKIFEKSTDELRNEKNAKK